MKNGVTRKEVDEVNKQEEEMHREGEGGKTEKSVSSVEVTGVSSKHVLHQLQFNRKF
jgi:hypothetical protein